MYMMWKEGINFQTALDKLRDVRTVVRLVQKKKTKNKEKRKIQRKKKH